MKSIVLFFDKFKNNALKEIKKHDDICNIIYKLTNKKIESNDISIKNRVLIIKGNQTFKNELYLKKGIIIKSLSDYKIIDIR